MTTTPEKIIVVGPTESILTHRGNRHPALARFLAENGYRLEYVTSNFYHAEKRWFSREEIDAAQSRAPYCLTVFRSLGYQGNVSVRRVIANVLFALRVFIHLLPRVNRRTVVILPSRPVEIIFCAAMLRRLRRTSVMLDIQDIWPDMLVGQSRSRQRVFELYCHAYLHLSMRAIDKFFHVAPSFVDWLHRYAPSASSIFIPLGFEPERWNDVVAHRDSLQARPLELVYVGLLQKQIDVMPLLEAVRGRADCRLSLIGDDGTGEQYRFVSDYISRHDIQNVCMEGWVKPDEMKNRLATMDIGTVPMLTSSLPNKVFDYIASGMPILAFGSGDVGDLVRRYGLGWQVAFDSDEISAWLDSLDSRDVVDRAASVVRIKNRFSRHNLHHDILRLIEGASN